MMEYAGICGNIQDYVVICMQEYVGICGNMLEYDGICRNVLDYVGRHEYVGI